MWNREGEYGEYGDGADRRGNTGIAIVLAGATDSCGGDAISCGASLKHNKVTSSHLNVVERLATGGACAIPDTCWVTWTGWHVIRREHLTAFLSLRILNRQIYSYIRRMASSGMLRRVVLVRIDVSEELSVSFIRVTRIGELGTTLALTSNRRIPGIYSQRASVDSYS
jgi:hypothetical protein